MKTFVNHSTDPYFNLALEEYMLLHWQGEGEVFYLWRNLPSVIVGRNQNVFLEVDLREAEKDGIPVVRRISGGGSVYHDLGNLNFTYLAPYSKENLNNYRKFTEPVIGVLNKLGIPAEFSEKSDIKIGNKKISGNAQSFRGQKMLHHGTLLFDADLERLGRYLKINWEMNSVAVRSQPSAVTNLKDYLPEDFGMSDLILALTEAIVRKTGSNIIHLRDEDLQAVQKLKEDKYKSWDWNFGESPEFALERPEARICVRAGRIHDFHSELLSDAFNIELKAALTGVRFLEKEVERKLTLTDERTAKEILDALFGNYK